jgi:hypothetical protein
MSLTPLINVPVHQVDSTVDVLSKGAGEQEHDEVFVTTTMTLPNDLAAEDVTLLLPLASEAQQQPLLRYVGDDIQKQSFTFDPVERSAYDQKVADALAALGDGVTKKEQKALASAIANAADSFSQAVITVKPGQRQLRFFYTLAAKKVEDRTFEFQVLGPLASFAIQAGGSIGVITLLPRNVTLIEAHGLQDPSNPGSEVPQTAADLANRHLIGWFWQNDPLFRVRYRY